MLSTSLGVVYHHITPEQLHLVWEQTRPHLQVALDTGWGEVSVEDIRRGIMAKQYDLFVAITEDKTVVAAMVTSFVAYPRYTALRIFLLGGNEPGILVKSVQEIWSTILQWAWAQGAEKVEAFCHPGMARLLRRICGFKQKAYIVVGCDIGE